MILRFARPPGFPPKNQEHVTTNKHNQWYGCSILCFGSLGICFVFVQPGTHSGVHNPKCKKPVLKKVSSQPLKRMTSSSHITTCQSVFMNRVGGTRTSIVVKKSVHIFPLAIERVRMVLIKWVIFHLPRRGHSRLGNDLVARPLCKKIVTLVMFGRDWHNTS